MTIGTSEELDLILADLGVAVSYTALAGGPQTTNGILDTNPVENLLETGLTTAGRQATLRIRDGSLTGLLVDRALTANAKTYHLRNVGDALADGSRILRLVEG